jgi:hypothetical protein
MCCKSAVVTSGWYEIFAMGVSLMNLLSLYLLVSRIISDVLPNHHVSWVQVEVWDQHLNESFEQHSDEELETRSGLFHHSRL